jgi:hypothetical protein
MRKVILVAILVVGGLVSMVMPVLADGIGSGP